MRKEFSAEEIYFFTSRFNQAQKDLYMRGPLFKYSEVDRLKYITRRQQRAVGVLGTRTIAHIERLLNPQSSVQERNFAIALINQVPTVCQEFDAIQQGQINRVTSGQYDDTSLWWTFSPYIFAEISPIMGEHEAVRKLIHWALDAQKRCSSGMGNEAMVNLPGLEIYNHITIGERGFFLSKDPSGQSHIFAREEAARLAGEVFLR